MKVKEINEEIYSLSCYCRPDRDGRGECQLYPCAPGSSLPGIAAKFGDYVVEHMFRDSITGALHVFAVNETVVNSEGYEFKPEQWDAIVNLMDDEIREEIVSRGLETNQEFFEAYAAAYLEATGEQWELDKANPVW